MLIKDAQHVLTMDDDRRELAGGDVHLQGGVIAAIGQGLPDKGCAIVDGSEAIVTPGLAILTTISTKR